MDPLTRRARAEAIVKQASDLKKAADELRSLLQEAVAEMAPLPYFLGSDEIRAVEAEPPVGAGPERGCVVVCADGELYEYAVSIADAGPFGGGLSRDERLEKLALPPQEYIPYAFAALDAVTQALCKRQEKG